MTRRPSHATIVIVAAAVLGGAALLFTGDLRALAHGAVSLIRSAGPVTFFVAMALLPGFGAPISFFSLTAGSVFGPQLGTPAVLCLSMLAITINMVLAYLLASRAFRPALQRLMQRRGYAIPRIGANDSITLIVLLRVTPGLPFAAQNYLLSLAATPFVPYLLVSCAIVLPLNMAFILFGEALLQGSGKVALVAVLLALALIAASRLIWKYYVAARIAPD